MGHHAHKSRFSIMETKRFSAASVAALEHPANRTAPRERAMQSSAPVGQDVRPHFVMVEVIDQNNKIVQDKVIDLNFNGTRNWLPKHLGWATDKGYMAQTRSCTDDEVKAYVKEQTEALQRRFSNVG
jgi:hypothetical protein